MPRSSVQDALHMEHPLRQAGRQHGLCAVSQLAGLLIQPGAAGSVSSRKPRRRPAASTGRAPVLDKPQLEQGSTPAGVRLAVAGRARSAYAHSHLRPVLPQQSNGNGRAVPAAPVVSPSGAELEVTSPAARL